jgi:Mg-chelatase subunit ChlD
MRQCYRFIFIRLFYCFLIFALPNLVLANTKDTSPPQLEVCFVLDTTGSMSALINGAKQKIWAIANEMINLEPRPDIKFCLIGYRDRGDDYITKVTDLSYDIDEIYKTLLDFKAQGGGDGPESVNQALYESVNDISWSSDQENTIKVIYLVGDFPPHMDYQNDVQYPQTVTMANQNDIVINTIQCGTHNVTTRIWKEIAQNSGGHFSRIAQSGNIKIVNTPMDQDFVALNIKLGQTLLPYGNEVNRDAIRNKQKLAESAKVNVIADRLSFNNRLNKIIQSSGDLIDDIENGIINLEDLNSDDLPEAMRNMTAIEKQNHITTLSNERKEYQRIIKSLAVERKQYILERTTNKDSSFDKEVIDAIKVLALKKGLSLN